LFSELHSFNKTHIATSFGHRETLIAKQLLVYKKTFISIMGVLV